MITILSQVLLIINYLSTLLLVLGLVRPWWVLWFMPKINRIYVIKIYGGIAAFGWITWLSLSLLAE